MTLSRVTTIKRVISNILSPPHRRAGGSFFYIFLSTYLSLSVFSSPHSPLPEFAFPVDSHLLLPSLPLLPCRAGMQAWRLAGTELGAATRRVGNEVEQRPMACHAVVWSGAALHGAACGAVVARHPSSGGTRSSSNTDVAQSLFSLSLLFCDGATVTEPPN